MNRSREKGNASAIIFREKRELVYPGKINENAGTKVKNVNFAERAWTNLTC